MRRHPEPRRPRAADAHKRKPLETPAKPHDGARRPIGPIEP
jgi:hypothetical protein